MVIGTIFQVIRPLDKKLLEDVTVRAVKGRICEVCVVSLMCMSRENGKILDK